MAGCSSGPQIALDPDSESFLEYARLIMTGEEKDIFSHLPDAASRQEFIAEFWRKRDPDPYTEENEFKTEFYNRIEYANRRFREGPPGWKTDRGRIYIYMGPPDKFDEFFTHEDPDVRGPILWWIYYKYELGIEFVDVNNNGSYKIRRYDGSFTEALDSLMLGQVPTEKGEKRKFVNFKLDYNKERKEIVVAVPADAFNFIEEAGNLRAELEFQFFVYAKNGNKLAEFKQDRTFSETEDKILQMKEMIFAFPFVPEAAEFYLDVIIIGKEGSLGKTRKIFKIKA
jgi:GWxTD domain-containing protein